MKNSISILVGFLCIINGNKETVIGYNRALTNQTAKNILNKDAPTSKDSAITKNQVRHKLAL
jgi:hypothetical protein